MTSEAQREAVKTVPADVTLADAVGTFDAAEVSLVNELKAKLNTVLGILRQMR